MSEQAITTTTSFINSSNDGICRPPISSNSSIDSGCNSSTNDSISSSTYQSSAMSGLPSAPMSAQARQDDRARANQLLMLPPQPNVPPPPPPPQLQENFYETNDMIYDNRSSVYGQTLSATNNLSGPQQGLSVYATFTNESPVSPVINGQAPHQSPPKQMPVKAQQSSPQQTFQQSVINQRSSTSSLESTSSTPLMPMNVKAMILHGLPSEEVLRNWLSSIKCDDQIESFLYHGYDMHLVTRMTPQDLAAIGCKSPTLRKKLLAEIKKLNLDYEIPEFEPTVSLEKWLEALKLIEYYRIFLTEGYSSVEKACQLTWEDLEEIGITKLGHQKRLLMAIDKVRRTAKQVENSQNDCAIYDVHPNHRVSLNGALPEYRSGTMGRVRSGLFQTRSGANLDHRGLPVATVMPALKHVNSPVINSDKKSPQVFMQLNESAQLNTNTQSLTNGGNSNDIYGHQNIYGVGQKRIESVHLGDLGATMGRHPPPMPPVRTNSLKAPDGQTLMNVNNSFATTSNNLGGNNATSFLRVPKLGTTTATTNKILTSGGPIQTLGNNSGNSSISTRSIYAPVREAPLPPSQMQHQQLIQSVIPEKIDEEISANGSSSFNHESQNNYLHSVNVNAIANSGIAFINSTNPSQLSNSEFPPPPPCQ